MDGLIQYVGKHPRIALVAVVTVMLIMLIASIIRAFQRWEILPDPILPEKVRRVWNRLQKAAVDQFVRGLSGRK